MKKLLVISALCLLGIVGTGGSALAQGETRSVHACLGAFVSNLATTVPPGAFGAQVSHEARDLYHPFGQTIVAPFAATCDSPTG